MIAIGSCGHNGDDERIYYKQIKTLVANGYKVKYFAYCKDSYINDEYNDNIEYRLFNSTEISQTQYKTILLNILKNTPPKIFHIHDMELLPIAFKLKKQYPEIKIIYMYIHYPLSHGIFSTNLKFLLCLVEIYIIFS